ncbi:iron chelate uptake ABC transporter family permease subunit [Myceligenerans halotolerans]
MTGTTAVVGRPRPGGALPAAVALTVVLLVSLLAAVLIGPADLSAAEVGRALATHLRLDLLGLHVEPLSPIRDGMVWHLRAPRALTAAAVGAGLAVCGVVMQSLTRNPLADPYLLGLSSGASLGAVLVLVAGGGAALALLPVAAFGGAVLALAAALGLAGALGQVTPTRTVLAGLAISQMCAAAVSFVIFWSVKGDAFREVMSWLMGSVGSATWMSVAVTGAATLVLGTGLMLSGSVLDAFTFGESAAATLGVDVQRVRWGLLVAVALLTGALVSQSGSIGFVGLILPHAVRLVTGARHRLLLPLSALAGASFLVWADTLARTVFAPRELPVGIVTAAVGAPVFAFLLWKGRARA